MTRCNVVLTDSERQRLTAIYQNRTTLCGECRMWCGGVRSRDEGYGVISFRGQSWRAHRLAYVVFHGRLPAGVVRHTSGNAACVNPLHLVDGTHSGNLRDAYQMGRRKQSKPLSDKQRKRIQQMSDYLTNREIADHLQLPESTVRDIVARSKFSKNDKVS